MSDIANQVTNTAKSAFNSVGKILPMVGMGLGVSAMIAFGPTAMFTEVVPQAFNTVVNGITSLLPAAA